jgi:glycerol-3-phosphate dehydrogenase
VISAEVIHAMRREFAVSLSDFIVRRIGMVWRDPAVARAIAPAAAQLMAIEAGWPDERADAEVAEFLDSAGLLEPNGGRVLAAGDKSVHR